MILVPLIALFVADVRWNGGAPGIWLVLPGLAIVWMASAEVLDLLRTPGFRPLAWTVYAGSALIFLAACMPMLWSLFGLTWPWGHSILVLLATALAVALAYVGEMLRYTPDAIPDSAAGTVMTNLALSVLVIVYVGLSMSFAAILRQCHSNAWGMAALVSVIFVVKISDSGAYFVGKSMGRHKLSPQLSPGKTIEGAVGGIVAAIAASWVFFQFLAPAMAGSPSFVQPLWQTVIYGIVLGAVGILGDLSESLMKRDVNRKDSSSWLPGLGGCLDVLDSLLFVMPIAYGFWASGLVGP